MHGFFSILFGKTFLLVSGSGLLLTGEAKCGISSLLKGDAWANRVLSNTYSTYKNDKGWVQT